ncbi:purine catabolism regulatory protein [Saccharopolyspora shandongensis]|uniref:Purine catabolism regulatory protein n=1 Tax=Saccharopolyspora shandongensis TaxID=418495 RepID=A0A1H2QHF2_9PSEU|nr:PucR family transcriptional regulator [Saccharopolyspora shandongensis]SDW06054.1 purine catabolism regulatory protein [Saccharopolyspora shandongensis]
MSTLTVQALVDRSDLNLTVVAGGDAPAMRKALTWALISELPDPSSYVDGGELVLTTGSRIPQGVEARKQYVDRLAAAGAVALGFGTTAYYSNVPADLVAAAGEAGLPLLSVPAETRFGAISRFVAARISDERQKEWQYAVAAQRDLTRASLSPYAARAMVERLAKATHSWVLLLDQDGGLRAGVPAARMHLARIRIDLPRLREQDNSSSLSMTVAGESVVLFPLTVRERIRGYLAVGRSTRFSLAEQSVLATAVSLLCADLHSAWGILDSRRRQRRAVFQTAVAGNAELASSIAEALDADFPAGNLRVALLGAPTGYETELLEHAENDHGLRSLCALVTEWERGRVVVVMPPAEGDIRTLESLLRRIPHARGAVSDPTSPHELPEAWKQVRAVFTSASGTAGKLALASDVVTAGVLQHLNNAEARGWAEALLAPLSDRARNSKIDLRHTLRTFLANNGQSDASASALGIHRHTLRHRMGKVAEVLGRDIDDPTTRAELWIALQLDDRL